MFRSIAPRISRTVLRPSVSQRYSFINHQERWLSVSPCLQYERKKRRNGEQHQRQQQNDQQPKEKKTTYSKRRFVNLEGVDKRSNRHLYTMPSDVYGTSDRVGQLLVVAGFNQAVEFLIHLPLDLQSTVAWNQLLGYCAKAGKSNEAETLFTQMRKRGLQPSDRTFAHLLTTFINSATPSAVERAESWVERMNEYGVQPTAYHYNILLNVYKKAGHNNQVMAKVRQMMRDDDRLPYPDQVSLSIALQVCPLLTSDHDKEIRRIWQYILSSLDCDPKVQAYVQQHKAMSSLQAKVNQLQLSDPTYRQEHTSLMEQRKSALKYPQEAIQVDDTLAVALIRALARSNGIKKTSTLDDGKREHFDMAMEIIDRLYGLRPNIGSTKSNDDDDDDDDDNSLGFSPGVTVLDTIVRYCGAVRRFDVGEALFDSALQKFPKLEPDSRAYDAYAWMQQNTRRKSFTKASNST